MTQTIVRLRPLFAAAFLFVIGNSLLNTLLSTRLALEGFSLTVIGLVLSWYFVGLLAGSFWCYHVIQKAGHLRAFGMFAAGTTAAAILHGVYLSPLFWGALRFAGGFCTLGIFIVIESWLSDRAAKPIRGRVFAIYLVLSYLGIGIGQQFINLADVHGSGLFLLAAIFYAVSLMPLMAAGKAAPQRPEPNTYRFSELFGRAPLAMLGSVAAGLTTGSFYAMMPAVCTDIGMTSGQMSGIMTLTVFSGLAVQYWVGSLSDRFSHTALLKNVAVAIALLSGILFMSGKPSFWYLTLLMGLIGALMFAVYPLAVAHAHDCLTGQNAVAISNGLLCAFSLGACTSPLLAAGMMSLLDTSLGLFAFWGVTQLFFTAVNGLLKQTPMIAPGLRLGLSPTVVMNCPEPWQHPFSESG